MRLFLLSFFLFTNSLTFSQKVTLTPILFNPEFELKKAPTSNVLKEYTEFYVSPFKKIPNGFTLRDASVFYKFDTLNCSLFIKKREDIESLYYYRDCEEGRWCYNLTYVDNKNFGHNEQLNKKDFLYRKRSCCEILPETDTSALLYYNEWVDFHSFIDLDGNLPFSIISNSYVTNKEYDEFIDFVKDSMVRYVLAQTYPKEFAKENTVGTKPFQINYKREIGDISNKIRNETDLGNLYYPDHEKYRDRVLKDHRKINYKGIDLEYSINAPEKECSQCEYYLHVDVCGKGLKNCNLEKGSNNFSELLQFSEFYSLKKIPKTNFDLFKTHIIKSLKNTNIIPDSLIWFQQEIKRNMINYYSWMSENYSINQKMESLPVVGVNFWQAKSFLTWKTYQHNKQLINSNQNYRVLYTLPLPEETNTNTTLKSKLPNINFENYIITNKEYEKFVAYVVDSVIQTIKIAEGNNIVQNKLTNKTFDDYGSERSDYEWYHNKKYYGNYYFKTKKEWEKDTLFKYWNQLLVNEYEYKYLGYEGIDTRKIFYRYEWIYYDPDSLIQYSNLDLSSDFYDYTHVYGTPDRSQFIIRESINIYPTYNAKMMSKLDENLIYKQLNELAKILPINEYRAIADTMDPVSPNSVGLLRFEEDSVSTWKHKLYDFKSNPEASITAITYEQAKAYYHWKNEVPYIPTKDEWNLIKQGINPYTETELEIPGPFFRYAIRVYPVRD